MVGFSHYMKKNLTCCSSTKQRVAWDRGNNTEYVEDEFSYNRFYHDAKNASVQRFSNKKTKKMKNVDEKHHSTPHKKTKFNQTNMNLNNEVNDSVKSVDIFFGRFKKHSNNSQSQEKHMNDGKGSVCKRSSEISIHYDVESESLSDVDWSWSLEDVDKDGRRSLLKISASRLLEQYDLEASKMDNKNPVLSTKTGSKDEPKTMEVIIKGIASKLDAVEQKLLEQDNHDNANTRRLIENDTNNFDEERNGVEHRSDDLINTYITTKSDENHHKKAIRDTQSVTSELTTITSPSTLPLDEQCGSHDEGIKHQVTKKDHDTSHQRRDSTSKVIQYHALEDDWNDLLNRARKLEQRVFRFARNVPEIVTMKTSKATDDCATVATALSTVASSNDSRNQSCSVCKKCDNPKNVRNEALSASCEQPTNCIIHPQKLDHNNNIYKRIEHKEVDINDSPSLSENKKELYIIEIPEVEEKRFQNAIEYSLQFGSFSSRSSEEDESEKSDGNEFDGASTSSSTIGDDLNTDSRDNYNISDYLENSDDEGPRGNNDIHLIEVETDQYVEYGNSFVESDEDSYYAVKTIHQRMETIREEDEEQDSYSRQISIVSIISKS